MNFKGNTIVHAVGLAVVLMAMPRAADAYIDPGTGSMILQLLLGGVAGALVVGKLYWHKLLALFRHGSKTSQKEAKEGQK